MVKKFTNAGLPSLAFLLIVVWGINWPILKVALHHISSYWFTSLRLVIAAICMFLLLILTKQFQWPKREDLPLIASIGILQLGFYMLIINIALNYVDVGRSAILSYATMIWVTPIAILAFNEVWNMAKCLGFILGLLGILILLNPWSLDWSDHDLVFGMSLLLLASFLWALTIIHARFGKWHSQPLILIPWQLLLGALVVTSIAFWKNPHPTIDWQSVLVIELLYSGLLATAFGAWAIVYLSRHLAAVTTSLMVLAVPALGMFLSELFLHETITVSKVLSMACIFSGVYIATVSEKKKLT